MPLTAHTLPQVQQSFLKAPFSLPLQVQIKETGGCSLNFSVNESVDLMTS